MAEKLNFRIITKNHAADSKIGCPLKLDFSVGVKKIKVFNKFSITFYRTFQKHQRLNFIKIMYKHAQTYFSKQKIVIDILESYF